MKKVLLVANHFFPYVGGLETFVLEVAKGLVKKGVAVDVLTFRYEKLPYVEKKDGFKIYRLPCYEIIGNTYSLPRKNKHYRRVMDKIMSHKYDVVMTNTRFFYSSLIGRKIAKKQKAKFIHIEHGNRYVRHPNPLVALIAWKYDQLFGRMIMKSADVVVAISKPGIKFCKKLGARKVVLIHNAINVKEFSVKREVEKKTNIVYVGRLIQAKGVQDLIRAVKGLDVKLTLIGEGNWSKKLYKLAEENKVDVKFAGTLKQIAVKKELSKATLFVNPSYSEGLPTSVLEAGAVGVPVIATDVGGTSEIIDDGKNGFLIPAKNIEMLRDRIQKLVKDKKLQIKFSKAIKEKVKEFDWSESVEKFTRLMK